MYCVRRALSATVSTTLPWGSLEGYGPKVPVPVGAMQQKIDESGICFSAAGCCFQPDLQYGCATARGAIRAGRRGTDEIACESKHRFVEAIDLGLWRVALAMRLGLRTMAALSHAWYSTNA